MPAVLYHKKRREIANPPTLAPSQLNERTPERISPQRSPDPPRRGMTPGVRPARRQIYSVLTKRAKRAVMATHQSGVVRKLNLDKIAGMTRGTQLPVGERVNIAKSQPESYGVRRSLEPNRNVGLEAQIRAEMGL